MHKAVFSGSLFCVLFLLAGTWLFPTNPIMWLAGITAPYVVFRVLAAIALVVVLATNPPRKLAVRLAMGAVSVVLVTIGVSIAISESVQLLDMVLCLELGIAFAIEALELNEEELQTKVVKLREKYARDAAEMPSPRYRVSEPQSTIPVISTAA